MKETAVEFVDTWFYAPDDFDKLGGIWPVRIGRNLAKPNYRNGPRQTPYCNMHFVREGRVQLHYGGHQAILNKGDMFCKFPNTIYTYQIVPGESGLRMTWITFDGHQALQLLEMIGLKPDKPFRRQVLDQDLEVLLQQIFKWCMGNSRKQLMTMHSLMYRIFGKLLPDNEQAPLHSPSEWVRRSLDFIQAYYTEKITIEDLAKHVGLHRTYLTKLFTKEVGLPPVNYLIRLRLDRARQLLQDSGYTVTEVALSVGYPDIYSFTRAFTRQFGVSPSHYRKQQSASDPSPLSDNKGE